MLIPLDIGRDFLLLLLLLLLHLDALLLARLGLLAHLLVSGALGDFLDAVARLEDADLWFRAVSVSLLGHGIGHPPFRNERAI